MNKQKKIRKSKNFVINKSENMSMARQILTSCVCSAIIAGVFSMITSWSSNKIAKDIEIQRYQFELHQKTYHELQEALDYFARVKVYDAKFINKFDYEADENNLNYAMEMKTVSMEEFEAQIKCLLPYLSKDAQLKLKESGILQYEFNSYDINENNLKTKESANKECKKYFNSVNKELEEMSMMIIDAIEYDIKTKYIPEYEYIL